MEKYDHIIEMEEILDKHQEILNNLNKVLDEFDKNQNEYKKLRDYYGSEKFIEDFDKSNNNELPKDLKCGVLSEDAVYNLIGDNYQTAIRMLELATKIIKNH